MRIGIDIGGTNTHAVLVTDQGKLRMASSSVTTPDIFTGVRSSVGNLLKKTSIQPNEIKGIFVGTTELLNAVYEERTLAKTALIRIELQPSKIIPALNWPESLRSFLKEIYELKSNNRYNQAGNEISCLKQLKPLYKSIAEKKIDAVCIVGAYSPMYENEEMQVKNEINNRFPDISVTVSHQFGSMGFIERENVALLNTLLSKVIRKILFNLASCFSSLSLQCPFWLTQSNGSLMTIEQAMKFPILTIASGAANSLKGASRLSGLKEMIAIDIGGSKIYVGHVANGELKEMTASTNLFGIDASLEMPEIISLPFGTGNIPLIHDGKVEFLPLISNDIKKVGTAWGGDTWTVSDCFLKLFPKSFYDPDIDTEKLETLSESECEKVVYDVTQKIKEAIDQLQNDEKELPIVLVGGGSPLFNQKLFGKYQQVINPAGYPFSSAIGACFSSVSEVIDKVYWLNHRSKEEVVKEAAEACKQAVVKKGADPHSVKLSYIQEYPFEYLRGEILRVKVKAVGEQIL
ncbi:hydantoinase/oxoprolinase N-terminal domain-containing protein [Weizmannia acidilactici]|uniref:hydantoinase/oxoprolinase N-terminal domain-containing protein n=1 Tax=Weizmannia acidilactici TaxID=2607726 RepID=UPI00124C9095|nr:hydantoinase/oxoprolinase N-terminal domain-containing protein [Weizmannia acidilactici]GER67726.1 hydantoinase [Weizmannia acidilactici]GER73604.1 hydantoinase [Weizmannia acidilactici]